MSVANRKSTVDINQQTPAADQWELKVIYYCIILKAIFILLFEFLKATYKKLTNQIREIGKSKKSDEDSISIVTESLQTIQWLEEKILSAIRYYNETKGFFGTLDNI